HPDSLVEGHINMLVKRCLSEGYDLFQVLQIACVNPVKHYGLEVGLLQTGDSADFILINNLKDFEVLETYINGKKAPPKEAEASPPIPLPRIGELSLVSNDVPFSLVKLFRLLSLGGAGGRLLVIEALDRQLITNKIVVTPKIVNGEIVSDIENDILKIVVVNRYVEAKPAVAFIKNFGFKSGAIASSVAHDSHNFIAVGVDDESICHVINLLIESKGGISLVNGEQQALLPLPIAGLMSENDGYEVAQAYARLDRLAKAMGSTLEAPFMTLSFMALLVIPSLKISDKGLFDGEKFAFTELLV
ncbi:MAG: adenine deaminase, partial [Verrucomicrobia bacterium]|nr:adenine deaminase [Cytophagales bacterium]